MNHFSRPQPSRRLLLAPILACSLTAAPVSADDSSCRAPAGDSNRWYWYSLQEFPVNNNCALGPGCDGLYLPPVRDWEGADLLPDDAPLNASADRSLLEGNVVTLEGDVVMNKGQLGVNAGSAQYDRQRQQFLLDGDVIVTLPGMIIHGDSAELSGQDGTGRIENAQFMAFNSGLRASASLLQRQTENTLQLTNTVFTQCPPDSEAWALKAEDIQLDFASGRGIARNTSLRVKGVPVFYTPWLDFPIDDRRSTGFLWPSIASSDGGLDISVPYYINLAANYDLTLTPRFLERRGEMLESEARYLNRWSEWKLSSAYLNDDKQANRDRWLQALTEQGTINEHWSTAIDYAKVSDDDYFTDLSLASLSVARSTHLNQFARVNYQSDSWRSSLAVQQYQTLANLSDPYRKLPQWTLAFQPELHNLRPQPLFLADVTDYENSNTTAEGGIFITGVRSYAEAGLKLPYLGRAGHLIGTAKSRHISYQLDEGVIEETPEVTAAMASLDAALVFERSGQDWLQTLEPRLYYLYSDFESGQETQPVFDTSLLPFSYQQLFRESRFAGYDRIDDSKQLSLGLSSRFIDQDSGREVLRLAIGQAFYFEDRRIDLPNTIVAGSIATDPNLLKSNISIPGTVTIQPAGSSAAAETSERRSARSSDLATEMRWQATEQLWLQADMVLDRNDGRVNQAHLGWHYRTGPQTLYNFGYSQRRLTVVDADDRPELKQFDASLSFPLGRQWQLFGRWHYDMEDSRSLESLFGVAYESCCWTIRALHQRALEPDDNSLSKDLGHDETILLEFQLKGLGGLGDKLVNVLEENIFGYQDD
ncbi:MAG: LPS-assembly protein [Bacteroidia bacterium]